MTDRGGRRGWRIAFGRDPSAQEKETAVDYLQQEFPSPIVSDDLQHERVSLCRLTLHGGIFYAAGRARHRLACRARDLASAGGGSPLSPKKPAFKAFGEERNIAVHAGRTEPGGHFRPEAAARGNYTGSTHRRASAMEAPERQVSAIERAGIEAQV